MKSAAAAARRLLSRQLQPAEVSLVLKVFKHGTLIAGRIGLAESLVQRNWLVREGRLVRLSDAASALLAEVSP